MASVVHMVGLGTAAIELKDRKIFSGFQLRNGAALNVVAAVIKLGGTAQRIEQLQQGFIHFVLQVDEPRAPVQVGGVREWITFAGG